MLASDEIRKITQDLQKQSTGKFARSLWKKLIEQEYATTLPPFSPLPHRLIHINRWKSKETLGKIIDELDTATSFTLDTESVNVFRKKNQPALIQIQLLSTKADSTVVLIDINHLPSSSSEQFEQIRHLCRIVLDSTRTIYACGPMTELDSFASFRSFTKEQIAASIHRNV